MKKIELEEDKIKDFIEYVKSFYGVGGTYNEKFFYGINTDEDIEKFINLYVKYTEEFGIKLHLDSIEREFIRDVLFFNYGLEKGEHAIEDFISWCYKKGITFKNLYL